MHGVQAGRWSWLFGAPLKTLCGNELTLSASSHPNPSQVSGGVSMGFWPIKCSLKWDFYQRLWAAMFFTPTLLLLTLLSSALLV